MTLEPKRRAATAVLALVDAKVAVVTGCCEERVFLGSVGAATNREELARVKITHVVAVGNGLPTPFEDDGIKYLRIEIRDIPSANLDAHFEEVISFLENTLASDANHHVLVHCFQGKSRSVSIVAAWLMRREGLSFMEAMDRIRLTRPQAAPNLGFAAQLRKFDRHERSRREAKSTTSSPMLSGKENVQDL